VNNHSSLLPHRSIFPRPGLLTMSPFGTVAPMKFGPQSFCIVKFDLLRHGFAAVLATASIAAHAGLFDTNLIVNGTAEAGPTSPDGYQLVAVPGWMTNGPVTVVAWNTSGFPTSSSPGPADRGAAFFAGGWDSGLSIAWQDIDVTAGAGAIDASAAECALSGFLGGYSADSDHATLTAEFRSASLTVLGSASVGPVTPENRNYVTGLLSRETKVIVPPATRFIRVSLVLERFGGGLYNDGYADNLSLVLTAPPALRWLGTDIQRYVAWPTNATDFELQTSAVLGSGANWTNWPGTPVVVGNEFQVPVNVNETQRYFRLRK
jgi:hypothetical protein